ncbi:hypothetical protein C4573_00630 [Candidatus Woesearchaeota archaeon]|nr:MAG: hypothetical protein C4573_00630 [Candidatus Woesearchaeota archaeon]
MIYDYSQKKQKLKKMVILYDQYNLPENIYDIIFATKQQVLVAKMLMEEMKQNKGQLGKTEMSVFATALHEGKLFDTDQATFGKKKAPISYNKRQFYDRILTPMKTMGLIDYDLYQKTYKISEKFNKNMMRIGLMWLQEVRKPAVSLKLKKP